MLVRDQPTRCASFICLQKLLYVDTLETYLLQLSSDHFPTIMMSFCFNASFSILT